MPHPKTHTADARLSEQAADASSTTLVKKHNSHSEQIQTKTKQRMFSQRVPLSLADVMQHASLDCETSRTSSCGNRCRELDDRSVYSDRHDRSASGFRTMALQ